MHHTNEGVIQPLKDVWTLVESNSHFRRTTTNQKQKIKTFVTHNHRMVTVETLIFPEIIKRTQQICSNSYKMLHSDTQGQICP